MAALLGILQLSADAFLQAGSGDQLAAAEIEALIAERVQAKKDRQFARADEIRDSLKAQGVILEDSREGTTWRRE
jgi:cysteinyl-tRNA synthetase